jgi:hypothetical protein
MQHGIDAIPTGDARRVIFTYAALCELSLFGPLLPQHAGLCSADLTTGAWRRLMPWSKYDRNAMAP